MDGPTPISLQGCKYPHLASCNSWTLNDPIFYTLNSGNRSIIPGLPLTPKTPHNPGGLRTVANQMLGISPQDYTCD